MKKVLTFVLALVMVLAIAAPALAFTGAEESTSTKDAWKVSVQLVDYYTASYANGVYTTLPAADRGYLYNEMVGAIVAVYIPEGAKGAGEATLQFKTENVKIWDVKTEKDETCVHHENGVGLLKDGKKAAIYGKDGYDNTEKTFRFLVLGQLTGASGSITAKIADTTDKKKLPVFGTEGFKPAKIKDYDVYIYKDDFYITDPESDDNDGMIIEVDEDDLCKAMHIRLEGNKHKVVTYNSKIAFEFTKDGHKYIYYDGMDGYDNQNIYKELKKVYDNICKKFSLDYFAEGYLYDSYFYGVKGTIACSDTAYLEPYVSTITVPDVVVDPPKTGDASTLVGIVMVIVALAGVVISKKVRA